MDKEAICQEILELSKKSERSKEFVEDFIKVNSLKSLKQCDNIYALYTVLDALKFGEMGLRVGEL